MNKQNRSLTLALLLSINQCYYINSGIGDLFDGIKNAVDLVIDTGVTADAMLIEAVDNLSKKTGLNFNILRQVATGCVFPAYMLKPDVYDQAIKQISAMGFLDEQKDMILELLHQINNIQNAAMFNAEKMADEAVRLNMDLYKLGKLFRNRIQHGRNLGSSSFENNHLISLIENSKEQAKNMQSQEEFNSTDMWIGAALMMVLLGICVLMAFILLRCGGEEAEVYSERVTRFRQNSINRNAFRRGELWWQMDENLRRASIDTLA